MQRFAHFLKTTLSTGGVEMSPIPQTSTSLSSTLIARTLTREGDDTPPPSTSTQIQAALPVVQQEAYKQTDGDKPELPPQHVTNDEGDSDDTEEDENDERNVSRTSLPMNISGARPRHQKQYNDDDELDDVNVPVNYEAFLNARRQGNKMQFGSFDPGSSVLIAQRRRHFLSHSLDGKLPEQEKQPESTNGGSTRMVQTPQRP